MTRSLGVGLVGDQIDELDDEGRRIIGNTFLLLVNADWKSVTFALPRRPEITSWVRVLDTTHPDLGEEPLADLAAYSMEARSMVVLRAVRADLDLAASSRRAGRPVAGHAARRGRPRPWARPTELQVAGPAHDDAGAGPAARDA